MGGSWMIDSLKVDEFRGFNELLAHRVFKPNYQLAPFFNGGHKSELLCWFIKFVIEHPELARITTLDPEVIGEQVMRALDACEPAQNQEKPVSESEKPAVEKIPTKGNRNTVTRLLKIAQECDIQPEEVEGFFTKIRDDEIAMDLDGLAELLKKLNEEEISINSLLVLLNNSDSLKKLIDGDDPFSNGDLTVSEALGFE